MIETEPTHANANAPIGLFDSGIGGLSVYLHLAQQLPHERYIYYADTLHVPYGNRTSADIEALTLSAVAWLHQQGCKLIVIACNSASAHALQTARQHYPHLPIVGLVPALKPAVNATKSGHVAVLATKATLEGALLNQVITDIALPTQTIVTKYFDPNLVPWVEAGMLKDSPTAQQLCHRLHQFAEQGVDQLVLGCTHYPFFRDYLQEYIESQQLPIQIVDSGQAIAERVKQLLASQQLLATPLQTPASPTTTTSALYDKSVLDVTSSLDITSLKAHERMPLLFYASKYDDTLGALVQRLLGERTMTLVA